MGVEVQTQNTDFNQIFRIAWVAFLTSDDFNVFHEMTQAREAVRLAVLPDIVLLAGGSIITVVDDVNFFLCHVIHRQSKLEHFAFSQVLSA